MEVTGKRLQPNIWSLRGGSCRVEFEKIVVIVF